MYAIVWHGASEFKCLNNYLQGGIERIDWVNWNNWINMVNCVNWINCVVWKEGNSLSLVGTAPHLKSYQQITVPQCLLSGRTYITSETWISLYLYISYRIVKMILKKLSTNYGSQCLERTYTRLPNGMELPL